MKRWLALFALALAMGTLGWLGGYWLARDGDAGAGRQAATETGAVVGAKRPAFSLPGLDGRRHAISEWDGKVVLLNFWATWCKPCREEMPMLDRLQASHAGSGLQVIGVALDRPGPVQDFVNDLGVEYPILVDDASGVDIARRYGNAQGVLPFSVLIRRNGTVADILYGKLERKELETALAQVL